MKEKLKKKKGIARLFEIAGERKGLLILAGILSAGSATCMLVPYWSVYRVLQELLLHASDLEKIDSGILIYWGWFAFFGLIGGLLLLYAALMASHVADSDSVAFNGNLFCYLLDMTSEKGSIVRKLESDLQKKAYSIQLNTSTMPNVENWLKAFKDADFVFTDSYHGCIFSIIFRKPFIVMGNRSRGLARFTSLLEMFGLMDLMIESSQELTSTRIDRCLSIDWIEVEECINKFRGRSISFLKNALSK